MTIRQVELTDVPQITSLYNWYIVNGVESFETEPLGEDEMRRRVEGIAGRFPYYVAVEEGWGGGCCYAPPWEGGGG